LKKNVNISKERERLYRQSIAVAKAFDRKPEVGGDYKVLLKSIYSN
jgi:hypothetical protein